MDNERAQEVQEGESKKQTIILFGTDYAKIPCFKQSFLTGISSGIGLGLLVFMFTSRVPLACHTMMGSFGAMTLGYFGYCRYNFEKEKIMVQNIKNAVSNTIGSSDGNTLDRIAAKVEKSK